MRLKQSEIIFLHFLFCSIDLKKHSGIKKGYSMKIAIAVGNKILNILNVDEKQGQLITPILFFEVIIRSN